MTLPDAIGNVTDQTVQALNFWESIYQANSVEEWGVAASMATALFVAILAVRNIVRLRLRRKAEETANRIDDLAVEIVAATRTWTTLILSMCLGALVLWLPPEVESIVHRIVGAILALQIGFWSTRVVTFLIKDYRQRKREQGDNANLAAVSLLGAILRLALWIVIAMLILDNVGMDITPLIAGLGIGGLALALAVQNTLADLFASVSIVLDRPFDVGDTITAGDMTGTVERIGIRTSRLRAPDGEEIIFGNNDLLKARLRNFKRMGDRRSVMEFCLDYHTPVDTVESVPALLEELISAHADVRFGRSAITGLGDSGISVQAIYYVTDPDYMRFVDIKQRISLAVLRAFEERGVLLAYPTRTVNVRTAEVRSNAA